MENEENRGLIHKKDYEDQLVTFCQFSVGTLSLSYSWILRDLLEHSWRVWHTWIVGARRKTKSKNAHEGININNYIRFSCGYQVACMIYSLVLACLAHACGLFVVVYHWHGGFPGPTVDFLALPFPG